MAEITVSNFNDLKNAITDATSTIIHLDSDITFSSGGIVIPKTKGDILIDGGGHKVTDYTSAVISDTINFDTSAGPAVTFTLQNVEWSGYNIYGVIATRLSSNNSNITLVMNNVQYTGPQFIYNRYGSTSITDCVANIQRNGSSSGPQEFCEANRLTIGGTVIVNSQTITSTNSVIWFPYSGSTFTVEQNAVFKVTAPTSYMFYSDAAGRPVITFKEGSSTQISTQDGLFYGAGGDVHSAESFTLEKNASFTATQTNRRLVPTFKCKELFSLGEGSIFHLFAPNAGNETLMYFREISNLSFNNPKSVILYNNGGNVFEFDSGTVASPNTLSIDAELVNRWSNATAPLASAGGFDDTPTAAFSIENYDTNVTAAISARTSAITAFTSNIQADDTGYPMDATSFNIFQSQVISMGSIDINADEVSDNTTVISGTTEPNANLRAIYNGITVTGTAGPDGSFSLTLPEKPTVGSQIQLAVNWNFLTKQITLDVVGSLTITRLPNLVFKCFAVPYAVGMVNRIDPDWYMEVTDTRVGGGDWYLYASLPVPMSTQSGSTLDDALTINDDESSAVIKSVPTLIRQGSSPPVVTSITWSEIEGFFLKVDPEFLYDSGRYSATLEWELRCTPRP